MDRKKIILIGFCGLMVGSALFTAINRRREPESPSHRRIDIPDSRFAPRQRPNFGENVARDYSNAIADAVEKVMPAVVVIRTQNLTEKRKLVALDPFGIYRGYQEVQEEHEGEGSGVIIDEMGHVLTSWHVIENAVGGEVILSDGTRMSATVVGFDKATDLAILKIKDEGTECPYVEFGDSDSVRVGDVAIAIGSPFSLQRTATVGHVSQKGRKVQILPYEDFIQTDAAINEGNSGGPLIDVEGRLIGINTAKKTDDQQKSVGIAFAVPVNLAVVVAKSIIEKGKHEWPWVGASFITVDQRLRKEVFGGAGVEISQVWNNTPAARAGLLPGAALLSVDGIKVESEQDVKRIMYNKAVGESVTFLLQITEKEQLEVELLLEEYPGLTG
ncbi:trypsin-like peptidase domain-containing protein [Pontiellaceae bacterium B1224]|nr:trypsin-like peptidase domain-containing protein [Pontiellaceae bacterium B1224]